MERGKGPVDLFPVERVHACTPARVETNLFPPLQGEEEGGDGV